MHNVTKILCKINVIKEENRVGLVGEMVMQLLMV